MTLTDPFATGAAGLVDALRPPATWTDGAAHFRETLRSPWYRLMAELHDVVVGETYRYGAEQGLRSVQVPITTRTVTCPSGLGSDSRPVQVSVTGMDTYLSDSAQFLLEYAMRMAPPGCFTVLPSLRAETPDPTHLSQFVHSEAEIAGDLDDLIRYVEGYVRHLSRALLTTSADRIRRVAGDVAHLEKAATADGDLPRITFAEAARLLDHDPRHVIGLGDGRSLSREGERLLMERTGGFVWITHFDHLSVPFYQAFGADESVAVNADLLFGVGEVVGSGQRHVTGDQVRRGLQLHGVPVSDYAWYVEMKDITPVVTSGFGMGLERFLLWVLRHDDIRDIPLVSRVNDSLRWPASVDRP